MMENLRYRDDAGDLPYSLLRFPDGISANVAGYGVLYVHGDALAACPEGWRLPTDEDWKKFEIFLGMDPAVADQTGTDRGFGTEVMEALNIPMAGLFNSTAMNYYYFGSWSGKYLWTGTSTGSNAYYRMAAYHNSSPDFDDSFRDLFPEWHGLPVSCMRDIK
jgi:uncharacterized protein (TIGR02145 family)